MNTHTIGIMLLATFNTINTPQDQYGMTALHHAEMSGDPRFVSQAAPVILLIQHIVITNSTLNCKLCVFLKLFMANYTYYSIESTGTKIVYQTAIVRATIGMARKVLTFYQNIIILQLQ